MALSELIIKKINPRDKAYKLSDGRGLFLLVKPNGSKLWRWKYRYGGKEKVLALGAYPDVSLKDARESQTTALSKLSSGADPAEERRIEKLKRHVSAEDTFEPIAREWLEQRREIWSASHARNILQRLENDVFPKIGKRPIRDITAIELLAVLRSIESRGALDIAHRARSYCGQVFRYAISTGRAERDIASDLRGALKMRTQKSHARLEERELPQFLKKLSQYDGDQQTQTALLLLIHTFVRTVEVRGAKWEEFDMEKAIWTIPASRMKMKQKHIVPLSRQSLELLKLQKLISHNREHVFPNRNKPLSFISENTLLYAIYRMGYHSRATSHGFRATASTILNENGFDSDAIERQLAHGERNKVRAAYNYAQYLPERKVLMQWWSDFIDHQQR